MSPLTWLLPAPESVSDLVSYLHAPLDSRSATTRSFERRLFETVTTSRTSTATSPAPMRARLRDALRRRAASAAASRSVRDGPDRSLGAGLAAPGRGPADFA